MAHCAHARPTVAAHCKIQLLTCNKKLMWLAALAATASNLVDIDAIAPACLPACGKWQAASCKLQCQCREGQCQVGAKPSRAESSRAGGYNLTPTTCGMPHGLKLANILQCFASITHIHRKRQRERQTSRQFVRQADKSIDR